MSLFPDITPLTNEIKVFSSQLKELNANSLQTNQLLTEIKELNSQILQELKKQNNLKQNLCPT